MNAIVASYDHVSDKVNFRLEEIINGQILDSDDEFISLSQLSKDLWANEIAVELEDGDLPPSDEVALRSDLTELLVRRFESTRESHARSVMAFEKSGFKTYAEYLNNRPKPSATTLRDLERVHVVKSEDGSSYSWNQYAQFDSEEYRTININFFKKYGVLPEFDTDGHVIEPEKKSDAVFEDRNFADEEAAYPRFPKIPGSIGELCESICPDVPMEFKVSAAFAHFGLMRSGLDTIDDEPWIQPRLFVALVTGAGKGKTAAINEINKAMKPITSSYRLYSSIDSGPSLCDSFKDLQNAGLIKADGENSLAPPMAKILLAPDEIKSLFEKAKVTANSKNTLGHNILELYETNVIGNRARTAKVNVQIETAHLAIVGGATPAGYINMFTGTGGGSDGMQTRISTIGIVGSKMPSKQRKTDAEAFTAAQQRLTDQAKAPATAFTWTSKGFELFDKWWTEKSADNVHAVRADGIAKKVLIILARTNDVTEFSIELVEAAIAFADYVIASRALHNPLDASNPTQSSENRIVQAFTKHGRMSQNDCRRALKPERFTGGLGPFLMAFKNMEQAGRLKSIGSNRAGYKIFELQE